MLMPWWVEGSLRFRSKGQVDDLSWSTNAHRKPVADAVGDDEGGPILFGLAVKARPVAIHQRTKAQRAAKHELAAVRMTGNRQRNPRRGRGIEGMRMMGQKNRERASVHLTTQAPDRIGNRAFVVVPGQAEQLNEMASDRNDSRFVHEQG